MRQTDNKHQADFLEQKLFASARTLFILRRNPSRSPVAFGQQNNFKLQKGENKQLYDQAGQLFGKWWMFDESESFAAQSEIRSRQSNTLMSLAVTYHLNRTPEKELPVLKRYLQINPSNPQALRLGIQTAGMLKDKEFADEVLVLMREHNPAALPLAESLSKKLLPIKTIIICWVRYPAKSTYVPFTTNCPLLQKVDYLLCVCIRVCA